MEIKPLSKEAVPRALEKAERYRLLNEPAEAESICLDVLRADPENGEALVMLLLALTDQFDQEGRGALTLARETLSRLRDGYSLAYYEGIIWERWAKALLQRSRPNTGFMAYEAFHKAMELYAKAESIRPPGNDDALLRWNTCARILLHHPDLRPRGPEERSEPPLE